MGRPPLVCPHGNLGVAKCAECNREAQRKWLSNAGNRKAHNARSSAQRRQPEVRARDRERYATDPAYRAAVARRGSSYRSKLLPEAVAEAYLLDRVRALAGLCPKFIDPSRRGAPDRMVMLPRHPVYFVEMKRAVKGVLASHQLRYHEDLKRLGHKVWVLWSKADVDDFINEVTLT